jgi:hypothetical protein
MTPERVAGLVGRWIRLYTRGLPAPLAERRIVEIDADVHDHIQHERARGTSERRISRSIASRMVRGLPADLWWRAEQGWAIAEHVMPEELMRIRRLAYRRGLAMALGALLVLYWLIGAVGIIGTEGDSADRLYLAVFATGAIGTALSRFRPFGMACTLAAMAVIQAAVAVVALATGMVPAYNSPFEVLLLNGFFVVLFAGSAWLFRRASLRPPSSGGPPTSQS